MSDPKTDYLQTILNQTAMTQQLVKGAQLVMSAGAEGIQEIANTDPEIILAAIVGLATVAEHQQEQINDLVEMVMDNMDFIDKLANP